ncbi:GTPase domain-containing protein [Desulfobacterales bacterium HSG17]|nr:GTPase domain-containing protein [Desulfobacterales bacterium HSG17]
MITNRYNVVFMGKTGVGKSTLINYLYGEKVAKTGVGKPVTRKGFHAIDFQINELPVRLFDSWGLEVGKDIEWVNVLKEELNNRGTDKSAEEWFHSIFYCISGSSHRIEDFDVRVIKQFIKEKYKIAVVFTKADSISEEEEEFLKKGLINEIAINVPIISACSEEKILRSGIKTQKFGKDEIELQAYNNFWDSIKNRRINSKSSKYFSH